MTQQLDSRHAPSLSGLVSEHMPALSVDAIQKWTKNPKALERALESALSSPPDLNEGVVPSIKVTVGTGADINSMKSALVKGKFCVGDWAADLLEKLTFPLNAEKSEVGIILRTVADLGFDSGAPYQDICASAKEMGLSLCSIEIVLQLRLQYLNQPHGQWFIVATEPVMNSRKKPSLFYVGHGNDGLALSADYGYP